MSWPYLLSEYPRSILSGEFPSMLLALIERGGLMTEEDIQKQLGGKHPELIRTLLDLHQDRLISYGLHHVRLTARGKHVLNVLQLGPAIVGDVLRDLELDGASVDSYQLVLSDYRERAFDQYLNSVGSLNAWKQLALTITEPDEPNAIGLGMRALLVRDLRTFYSRLAPSEQITKSLPETFGYFLNQEALEKTLEQVRGHEESLSWLVLGLEGVSEAGKWLWKKAEKSPSTRCLMAFDDFRHSSNAHDWFDRWYELSSNLEDSLHPRTMRLLQSLQDFLSHDSGTSLSQLKTLRGRPGSAWWREAPSSSIEQEFLSKLMNAPSLEALSMSLGFSSGDTRRLLTTLMRRSEELLAGAQEQMEKGSAAQSASKTPGSSSTHE